MNNVIIGYGQIGQAVDKVVSITPKRSYIIDPNYKDGNPPEFAIVHVLHICIPYIDQQLFFETVKAYIEQFKPEHIIIWSTVAINTTEKIPNAVHSPVEGKHPFLMKSIQTMVRWVGANTVGDAEFFYEYFQDLGIETRIVSNSNYTEALKLLSTAEYGVNIAFADYKQHVAQELGMDYKYMKLWNEDYNYLYKELGDANRFQKFVLDPPHGKIGGHCVVPNAEILGQQYPNEHLEIIKRMK